MEPPFLALFQTMGLFLFIDLTLQLSIYPALAAFALVLDPVLDDPGQML